MIVDTSAVVAVLFGEPDAKRYAKVLHDTRPCRMSAATYVEVSIVIDAQAGAEGGREFDTLLQRCGVGIESLTEEHARLARQAYWTYGKGRHPAGLNFGDCFAYALAKASGEPLLFKGNDFAKTDVTPAL